MISPPPPPPPPLTAVDIALEVSSSGPVRAVGVMGVLFFAFLLSHRSRRDDEEPPPGRGRRGGRDAPNRGAPRRGKQGDRRRDDRSKHRALSDRPTRPLVDDTEDSDGGESETATKVQTEVISDDEDDPSEVSRGVRDRGEDGKDEDEDEEVARRPRREKKAADRAGTKKTPRREKKSSVAANKHHLERELGFSEMGGKPHSRRFAF